MQFGSRNTPLEFKASTHAELLFGIRLPRVPSRPAATAAQTGRTYERKHLFSQPIPVLAGKGPSTYEFQIIGRIGRIAEVGTTLKINIASDYPRKDDNGDWQDNTHWNTVTVFNERTIAWIKENTKPGDLVHARGRIRNGSYEKDGDTVYTTDLVTTEFLLLAKHQPKDADDSLVDKEA